MVDLRFDPTKFDRNSLAQIRDGINLLKMHGFFDHLIQEQKQQFFEIWDRKPVPEIASSLDKSKQICRFIREIADLRIMEEGK